jgi:thiol-disulfide isomerase/thioredoxin
MCRSLFRPALSILLALAAISLLLVPTASAQSSRSWVGIVLGDTDSQPGVVVDVVLRRSPAHEAGIEDGDRILAANGRPVRTTGKLESILRDQRPGRSVVFTVGREGTTTTLEVAVATSPSAAEVLDMHHRGFPIPDVEISDLDGDDLAITGENEGLVVLEFWATWCSVCRQVSRKLEDALEEHPDAFTVLSVTSEDAETVREHLKTHPKAHTIALDEGNRAHEAFLVNSYPFVVVVEPDGKIQAVVTSISDMDELIAGLVGTDDEQVSEDNEER